MKNAEQRQREYAKHVSNILLCARYPNRTSVTAWIRCKSTRIKAALIKLDGEIDFAKKPISEQALSILVQGYIANVRLKQMNYQTGSRIFYVQERLLLDTCEAMNINLNENNSIDKF